MTDMKPFSLSSQENNLPKNMPILETTPQIYGRRFSARVPSQYPKMGIQPIVTGCRINDIPQFKLRRNANDASPNHLKERQYRHSQKPLRSIHMDAVNEHEM